MKYKKFKNNLKIILLTTLFYFLLIPNFVSAQTANGAPPATPTNFKQVVCILVDLALDFVPYIIVIAVGAFLMGLTKYVSHGDDEEKRGEGVKLMVYGILGFFFMVSIWGILGIFTQSFNIKVGIPQFKSTPSNFVEKPGC